MSNSPDGGVMEMLRLRNEKAMQVELWRACLPSELFALGEELSRVDRILSDERFLEPFRKKFNSKVGRPTIPVEVYIRLMYLKFRYNLGYETLCKTPYVKW